MMVTLHKAIFSGLPGANGESRSIPGPHWPGFLAGILSFFLTAVPLHADSGWLNARHANMQRYYEEAHRKPPTLLEIKAAAEHGDANAQYQLADIYQSRGDFQTALGWFRKA